MKLFIGNSLRALRCVMYYFIEILYLILTVTSLSLETDQILRLNLRFNKTLKHTQKPRSQPEYEENLDSDKIALIALRRDLTGPVTSRSQNYDPSLWYSVKSLGSAAALSLSSDELSSSESKDESPSVERPEITIKTTARTTHRTQKVLYRTTKFSDFQTMKYEKGTTRKKKTKHRDSRHYKQKKKRAGRQRKQSHSKITTVTKRIRKKKHSKKHEDPNIIGLYIDNVRQIFYNKTHYSPYSKPLHGIYDINYLWSKQKDVKKFDETLKLPLPSLKRQTDVQSIQGHKRNKNNKYKEYHIDTSPNNIVTSKHRKIQSEEKTNGPIGTNYTNKTLVESDDEMDLTFRQKLLDGVKYANINLNNLLSHYLNKPELARLQAAAKIGLDKLTDFTISFPIQWIDTVQNISQTAADIKKPIGLIEAIKDNAKEQISKSIVDTAKEELGKKIIETAKEEVGKKIVVTSKEEHGKKIIEAAKDEVDKKITDTAIEEFGKQIIDTVKQELGQDITKVQPQLMKKLTNKTRNVGNMLNKTFNLWQPWIHRVRDDVKVNSFIHHILKQYLNLFHDIENKRRDNGWKTYIRSLARNYEDKFNEYIEDTAQHKIKSKMGTKRVILNSISISNRIVIRLFNLVIDELVKNGLSENSEVSNVIAKKINEETASVLKRACSKLDVCKNRNSFINYLSNVLKTFSGLDSDQFNRASRAITAAFKSTDFTSLGEENNQHFRDKIVKFENSHQLIKRAVVEIIKNIVTNRNTPLVVYGDSQYSR